MMGFDKRIIRVVLLAAVFVGFTAAYVWIHETIHADLAREYGLSSEITYGINKVDGQWVLGFATYNASGLSAADRQELRQRQALVDRSNVFIFVGIISVIALVKGGQML